jgi:hypothetical protein
MLTPEAQENERTSEATLTHTPHTQRDVDPPTLLTTTHTHTPHTQRDIDPPSPYTTAHTQRSCTQQSPRVSLMQESEALQVCVSVCVCMSVQNVHECVCAVHGKLCTCPSLTHTYTHTLVYTHTRYTHTRYTHTRAGTVWVTGGRVSGPPELYPRIHTCSGTWGGVWSA